MKQLLAILVGLALGFGLARIAQPVAPTDIVTSVASGEPEQAGEVGACVEELSALYLEQELRGQEHAADEQLVRDLEHLLEQNGLLTESGTPMEWPSDLPDHLGPSRVTETVSRLQSACPEVVPTNARLDCSEFPCSLTWLREAPVDRRDYALRSQCPLIAGELRDEVQGDPQPLGERASAHFMRLEFWPESMRPTMREWRGNRRRRSWARLQPIYYDLVEETYEARCSGGLLPACEILADAAHAGEDRPARIAWMKAACDLGSTSACEFIGALEPDERQP